METLDVQPVILELVLLSSTELHVSLGVNPAYFALNPYTQSTSFAPPVEPLPSSRNLRMIESALESAMQLTRSIVTATEPARDVLKASSAAFVDSAINRANTVLKRGRPLGELSMAKAQRLASSALSSTHAQAFKQRLTETKDMVFENEHSKKLANHISQTKVRLDSSLDKAGKWAAEMMDEACENPRSKKIVEQLSLTKSQIDVSIDKAGKWAADAMGEARAVYGSVVQ